MPFSLNLPPNLTEAELYYKDTYEKLKELRRQIQQAKAAVAEKDKPEAAEKRLAAKRSTEDAEGATEVAKRLVLSGKTVIAKKEERQSFKRSKVVDRSSSKDADVSGCSYQSYSTVAASDFEGELSPTRRPVPRLHDSFVSGAGGGRSVYVRGYDLADEPLRRAFGPFGTIVQVTIDDRKKSAFIDYEKNEDAEKAIEGMNNNMVNGITLRVSLARKRAGMGASPQSESAKTHAWHEPPTADASREPERRGLVSYDEADLF